MEEQNNKTQQVSQQSVTSLADKHSHPFSMILFGVVMLLIGLSIGYIVNKLFVIHSTNKVVQNSPNTMQSITPTSIPSTTTYQNLTTYTNNVAKFSIQYPGTWTITESHDQNPNVNYTVVLKGKEGQIMIQWGGQFGGGCDPQFDSTLQLKETKIPICKAKDSKTESWNQIYSPANHNPEVYVYTSFQPQYENLMKKIFSTLSFTN